MSDPLPSPYHLIFALCAIYGLAWIVSSSKASQGFRHRLKILYGENSLVLAWLECPVCQSWWYGLGAGHFLLGMDDLPSFAFALVAVWFSLAMHSLITFLQGSPDA